MTNIIDSLMKFLAEKSYETGTTNGWEWVKYADGRCEFSKVESGTTSTNSWASYAGRKYLEFKERDFPFRLTKLDKQSIDISIAGGVAVQSVGISTDELGKTPSCYLYAISTDDSARKNQINFRFWGRWK